MRHAPALIVLGLSGFFLAACAIDPFERSGTWSVPQNRLGANDANLRVMVTDPADLVAGTGEENTPAVAAGPPVRRLLNGRRAPLPQSNVSTIRVGGEGATPAQPASQNPQ